MYGSIVLNFGIPEVRERAAGQYFAADVDGVVVDHNVGAVQRHRRVAPALARRSHVDEAAGNALGEGREVVAAEAERHGSLQNPLRASHGVQRSGVHGFIGARVVDEAGRVLLELGLGPHAVQRCRALNGILCGGEQRLARRRGQGAGCALELRVVRDDVPGVSRADPADAEQHVFHGIEPAGQFAQTQRDIRRRKQCVAAEVRLCDVRPFAAQTDEHMVAGGGVHSVRQKDRAERRVRRDVEAVDALDAVRRALG